MKRFLLRILLFPLEAVFRLLAKLELVVRTNSQLVRVRGAHKCSFGTGLSIQNQGKMEIGEGCEFANFVQLSTHLNGEINIGSRVFVGDNTKVISDNGRILIGSDVLIAEGVSIRASNHGISAEKNINQQNNTSGNVEIGDDVWISKGVTVLKGAIIPYGVVIGANSVVTSTSKLEKNGIYAGVPIVRVGARQPSAR